MSRYRMSLDSGWESNAFEPFKEVEFKTADKKTIVYSKIVHGKWIAEPFGYGECSHCHAKTGNRFAEKFCYNCGAKMDGAKND